MFNEIGTIVAIILGVGGVVVSVTTQLNHVAHIKADQEKHQKSIDDLYVKHEMIISEISALKTSIAEYHTEFKGMVKNIEDLCNERHK